MKKLLIEEKARNYDEAIERAKKCRNAPNVDKIPTFANRVIEDLFPELKESEDNMILKQLRDFFKNHINSVYEEIDDNNAVLAWLEKQGEQILANSAKTCKIEPSTWSEDDEDNFKHLMDEIVCLGNSRNSANRLHYDRLIKFLDELKNRVQPREEWCDKDERMLDRLIAYFEKRVAFTDDDNPRYANWLKSLRPRTQWKPSEEDEELKNASISYLCNLRDSFESRKWDKEFIQKCVNWLRQMK